MAPKRAAELTTTGRRTKVAKMPQLKVLTSSSKEELVRLIGDLCRKHPVVRQDVESFTPTVPVDNMLTEISKAATLITKKLPWDKYGRGNQDTYAYNRVRSFISAFAKVLQGHLKTVEVSGQEDKIEEFLHACYQHVLEMHSFSDPKHNATRTRLQLALQKVAKKHGVELCGESGESDGEVESGEEL